MKNGRIAIPCMDGAGSAGQGTRRFDHCELFTLVDVRDGKIKSISTLHNKEYTQDRSMVPVVFLAAYHVNALIVGCISLKPLLGFKQLRIDVYHDTENEKLKTTVNNLINGKLPILNESQACDRAGIASEYFEPGYPN